MQQALVVVVVEGVAVASCPLRLRLIWDFVRTFKADQCGTGASAQIFLLLHFLHLLLLLHLLVVVVAFETGGRTLAGCRLLGSFPF
jgi:hypothetical protein